ncbi:hypothetical protein ACFPRL_04320 [Pseudoclavibacter helvolus]
MRRVGVLLPERVAGDRLVHAVDDVGHLDGARLVEGQAAPVDVRHVERAHGLSLRSRPVAVQLRSVASHPP